MKILLAISLYMGALFTCNAQKTYRNYYIGTRGERVEYDTAMVVKLSQFREDVETLQESNRKVDSLTILLNLADTSRTIIMRPADTGALTREELKVELDKLRAELPEHKWYHNPLLYLGVGALLGVYFID